MTVCGWTRALSSRPSVRSDHSGACDWAAEMHVVWRVDSWFVTVLGCSRRYQQLALEVSRDVLDGTARERGRYTCDDNK